MHYTHAGKHSKLQSSLAKNWIDYLASTWKALQFLDIDFFVILHHNTLILKGKLKIPEDLW